MYTKLFGSILHSTIWETSVSTRIVWVTMLALSDKDGRVMASVPGLARAALVSRAECEAALEYLLAPDPDSRTPDYEGRRIEEIDGGWFLLNHAKYRELGKKVEHDENHADAQKRYREKKKTEKKFSCDVCGEKHTSESMARACATVDLEKQDEKRAEGEVV